MDNRLQTQVLALAMQIIGIKDPNLFKQAMTMMSEQGRAKFLNKCAEIILSGDTSEENIAQAQQEALKAILEGQLGLLAILAKYGNRITYLNRFYTGGRVRTYDGGIMTLKKPLTKDQVDGKLSIGLYKGKWMFLNKELVATIKSNMPKKDENGITHINRAYNGMLLPKPQKYSIGGAFKDAYNFIGKNAGYIDSGSKIIGGLIKTIQGMNRSNRKEGVKATLDITQGNYFMHQGLLDIIDLVKAKTAQASQNASPATQTEKKNSELVRDQLTDKLKLQLPIPQFNMDPTVQNFGQSLFPNLDLNLNTSLNYPTSDNTLKLDYLKQ